MRNKPNVILVTIDSLRADHLGYMGYKKHISPNIDALAKKGTVFTRAYSVGPITPHAFPSILTSTYPFDCHGVRKIESPRVLISEIFQKNGFITAAFHSNSYVSGFFGYDKGWDFFEDISVPYEKPEGSVRHSKIGLIFDKIFKKPLKEISLKLSPKIFFWIVYLKYRLESAEKNFKVRAEFKNQAVKDFICSVENEDKPFFVWIHYMDVHAPYISRETRIYNKPLSFSEIVSSNFGSVASHFYFDKRALPKSLLRFGKKCFRKIISFYDQEIEYLDEQIGALVGFLKERKLYHDSIICLTADHGDEFLEHGGASHFQKLYNELLHVPLLIKDAHQKETKIVDKKVSLIDVSPTLCDLAGMEMPVCFKGKNLFVDAKSLIFHQTSSDTKGVKYYVFGFNRLDQCKIGCQSEQWKYIIDYGTRIEELYNLFSDPQEQNNIARLEPEVIYQMRKVIQEFNEKNPPFSLLRKK